MRAIRACACALAACGAIAVAFPAFGQGPPKPGPNMTERDIGEHLIWNSPWEGRADPPRLYSFRTVFRKRRDGIVAETVSYATNQRSTSLVNVRDGRINWQDSNGAEVNVAVADGGDLVGTATSPAENLAIVFKSRP